MTGSPDPARRSGPSPTKLRLVALAVSAAILACAAVVTVFYLRPAPPAAVTDSGVMRLAEGTTIGGPFHLTDQSGRAVSEADFAGRFMLIYFGFSNCPDVCPTELQTMGNAMDALGSDSGRVVPIFITVDPERDTPEQLKSYVAAFHPKMVGLTGSAEEIAAVAKAYKV
jgi:protein SCO1/2